MEAVNARLIDLESGIYCDPTTGEVMPLSLAVQRGLISAAVAVDGDVSHHGSQPVMETESDHWKSTGSLSDTNVAGSRQLEAKELLTRKVETKTVVDISSLPRHAVSSEGLITTGSRTALVTNGIRLEQHTIDGEPVKGVEELDSLIAKMKRTADWTDGDDTGDSAMLAPASGFATGTSRIHYENGGFVTSSITSSTKISGLRTHEPLTLDEALSCGLIDAKTGLVTDPSSGQKMTVGEAVAHGIIDGQASTITDPSTGRPVSLTQGLQSGIVDGKMGKIRNTATGKEITIEEAVRSGVIIPQKTQEPLTLDEALSRGPIDAKTGLVTDPSSGQKMTIGEAVARGIIDGQTSTIIDPSTGRPVSLTQGLQSGSVDGKSGKMRNTTELSLSQVLPK